MRRVSLAVVRDTRLHLFGAETEELRARVAELGLDAYRATQISRWIFEKRAASFDDMSNLPLAARQKLREACDLYRGRVLNESVADDGTTKLLIGWPDGASVEAVWIPHGARNTACISSQVGCPVGCRFCASGMDGMARNLSAGEIVEQVMHLSRVMGDRGRITNIVMMGMGEPLANYAAVVKAIRILNSRDGLGMGARRITLSTVGLPAQIRRLAGEGLQINLALSLHAPDDDLRRELVPWGKGVEIRELIDACDFYFKQTGREITLEYVLLDKVNNLTRHAEKLARIARRLRCNVNLLRYNPVPGLPYERPTAFSAYQFLARLRARGINAHVRTSRGRNVDAACGQLRRKSESWQDHGRERPD